jgi:hypothetical protein
MLVLTPRKIRLPACTFLGCVVTRHRSSSCRGLCVPIHGVGACGRLAPHVMVGRTRAAIAAERACAADRSPA